MSPRLSVAGPADVRRAGPPTFTARLLPDSAAGAGAPAIGDEGPANIKEFTP